MGSGGYTHFIPKVKKTIDDSFDEIIELINKYKYHTIYFSAELDGSLGTSIFRVNPKVISYITNKIYNLSSKPVKIIKLLSNDKFDLDYEFDNNDNNDNNDNEIIE